MVDETYIDNELLISLVEQKPLLWDKTMELYKNRVETLATWKEIMIVLDPNIYRKEEITRQAFVKLIIKRWTHIRDSYSRSLNKIEDQRRSGSSPKTKPYVYSKKLSFLQKVLQPKETISNVITDNENTESENYISEENETSETDSIQTHNNIASINLTPILKRRMNNNVSPIDAKMITFMDSFSNNEPKTMNRHLSFFNGILPSLDTFDEDEILEFQMGVLQLLKKIRNSRQNLSCPQSAYSQRIFYSGIPK